MSDQRVALARKRATAKRARAMRQVNHSLCQACSFAYPPILHLHHVRPLVETGVESEETVWLCPNCHAMVHEIIRVFHSGKKVKNLQVRLDYLGYWLSEICPDDVADKLRSLAERGR